MIKAHIFIESKEQNKVSKSIQKCSTSMYTFLSVAAAMIFVSAELNESLRWDLFRSKHMLYKAL